jgi:polyferredoxin
MPDISFAAAPLLALVAFLGTVFLIIKRWTIPARGFTQLGLFVIGEIAFTCNKGLSCQNCPLSFGICPLGAAQRIGFIRSFPFYISLLMIAILGLLVGTLGCGWACPVGFIQDILYFPGIAKFKIPLNLKKIRYVVLISSTLLIFLELRFNFLSLRGISVFHKSTVIMGILILIFAVVAKRPFCRLLCPLGAIYGKLNKISPLRVNLNKNLCTACGKCSKVCIDDIEPTRDVNADLCVKCFNCQKACAQTARSQTAQMG